MALAENPSLEKELVVKRRGEGHFIKDFGGGTTSERIILPEGDNCRVKVTMFRPKAGFSMESGVVYSCDETVFVVEGQLKLHLVDGSEVELNPGDSYHVPAGTSYGVTALTDSEVLCTFSAAEDGTMPDSE